MEIALGLITLVVGVLTSWGFAYYYYRRGRKEAIQDTQDQLVASRIVWADHTTRAFLVAMYSHEEPLPLYSMINWKAERQNGEPVSVGSGGSIMFRSIAGKDGHLLTKITKGGDPPHVARFGLTERGRECAEYLLRTEFVSACFETVDDTDAEKRWAHEKGAGRRLPSSSQDITFTTTPINADPPTADKGD